jgi:hypothetical protein
MIVHLQDNFNQSFVGKVVHVIMTRVVKDPKKTSFLVFYEKMGDLDFELMIYKWIGREDLFAYSNSALGWKMLKATKKKYQFIIQKRWTKLLPPNLNLKWINTWQKIKNRKEVGFI